MSAAIRAADPVDRVQGREHDKNRHRQEPPHNSIMTRLPSGFTDDLVFFMPSLNQLDSRSVPRRLGERRVASDDRRIERLGQRYVHCVVRCEVFAQLPRTSQEIDMGVTVEIEVSAKRSLQEELQ